MAQNPPNNLDVWVLAGQSNMEGGGLLRDALSPNEQVWNFSSAGVWEIAAEPLHQLWESFTENHPVLLRADSPEAVGKSNAELADIARQTSVTGAGLGLAFGIARVEKTGKPIGLIPCAHGGTALEQWDFKKKTTHDLYGGMLERIRRADGNLRGFLWYQGESDAIATRAVDYGQRLAGWIEALREDLSMPKLPVFVVQLGRVIDTTAKNRSAPSWETVREALRLLPEHLSDVAATSAIDLGLHDEIHLDGASLVRLGIRLAKLAGGEKAPTISSLVRDREEEQIRGGHGVVQICCNLHGAHWGKTHPLSGFSLHDPTGAAHPTAELIQAEVAKNDPTALRLVINQLPDETLRIGYGLGLNPFCNVVDERDLPLAAFLPKPLDG